ncbi:TPA: hypothetical protein ACH3X3_000077 [Trebouxia sp. C0006]
MRKRATELNELEEGSNAIYLSTGLDRPHRHTNGCKPSKHDRTLLQDTPNMLVLVLLYMMQGVPLGLTMGAMPFLLQSKASYTQIGIFSVASYPYSFKLLWSPIVDSIYSLAFGRRKSWVVPIQLGSSVILLTSATWLAGRVESADVVSITALFFLLVLMAATQDIAVDGWALTLLARNNVGYASTCQTLGMNIGYFTSFTAFLALNDADFCNNYLRAVPYEEGILPLAGYLKFWGWFFVVITILIAVFKHETNFQPAVETDVKNPEETVSIGEAYRQLWEVVKLPAVRRFAVVLVTFRLGMLPAEQAAPLKLLEKGVSKEALAGLVLLEFPCELASAVLAGRWASSPTPFTPFMLGYKIRLVMAAAVTLVVYYFPSGASSLLSHPKPFLMLAVCGLLTSFTSTLMFTAMGSFFNRISDPGMGGAYLTLLNTIANMGVTLPKLAVFAFMDFFTVHTCMTATESEQMLSHIACTGSRNEGSNAHACGESGGQCVTLRDGFYPLSFGMIVIGALLGWHFSRTLPQLEAMPIHKWRAKVKRDT